MNYLDQYNGTKCNDCDESDGHVCELCQALKEIGLLQQVVSRYRRERNEWRDFAFQQSQRSTSINRIVLSTVSAVVLAVGLILGLLLNAAK